MKTGTMKIIGNRLFKTLRLKAFTVLLLAAVGIAQPAHAQYAYFPTEGTITYEKTVHVKNLLNRHIRTLGNQDPWQQRYYESMRDQISETVVLTKKLAFRGDEMLFEPVKETFAPNIRNLLNAGLLDNQSTVYQHLGKNESKVSFEMGGANIYIEDALLDVKWKITNEYRQIAGFECRRANGVTLDSVYVVAFYTDQIPTSAGPGTVHGLPGMILGLVVPEQHFNIYATKVDYMPPTIRSSIAGRRASPITRQEMMETLGVRLGTYMTDQQKNLIFAGMLL